jgi:hypothetical protein
MKKKALADRDALNAARRVIAEARERRKGTVDDGVRVIITGAPRPGDGIDWPKPEPCKRPYFPSSAPRPRPVEPEPPREWHYVWVQTRGPMSEGDPGQITEGQYATAGSVLYLEDTSGNPIASQKLRPDDNAPAVARRLLKEKWRAKSPNVSGFYDSPVNSSRTFH